MILEKRLKMFKFSKEIKESIKEGIEEAKAEALAESEARKIVQTEYYYRKYLISKI